MDKLYLGDPAPFCESEARALVTILSGSRLQDFFPTVQRDQHEFVAVVKRSLEQRGSIEHRVGGDFNDHYGVYLAAFLGKLRDMSWAELLLTYLRVVSYWGTDAHEMEDGLRLVGLISNDPSL